MKKSNLLVISLLGVSLLSSCGGKKGPDISGTNDLQFDENNNVIYKDVELNLWSVTTGEDATTQDAIINQFNEMYNGMIKVNVTHYSRYDLEQFLTSTMQFDKVNAPDMLFHHGARVKEYNSKGYLLPIEDYYEIGNISLDKDDFAPSLVASTTLDAKMYATPIDCHSATVTIREDILTKNGLKVPNNYKELVSVCETAAKLAKEGKLYIRGENSDGYKTTEWRLAPTSEEYKAFPISYGDMWVHEFAGYTAAIQNGGEILDKDGKPGWNTEETANGLQVLRDWIFPSSTSTNKLPLSEDFGSDYDVGLEPFKKGNAIFKLDGPWVYQSDLVKFDRDLKDDGGRKNITTRTMGSLFAKDETKPYANKVKGEGHAIMLSSTVESHTERCAAAVFADYMAYYSGIEWAKRGHIPAANSVLLSEDFKNDPAYEEYVKYWGTPNDYIVYGPTEFYSYVDQYFKESLQQSISKTTLHSSIKDILNKKYRDCIDYIDLYL